MAGLPVTGSERVESKRAGEEGRASVQGAGRRESKRAVSGAGRRESKRAGTGDPVKASKLI